MNTDVVIVGAGPGGCILSYLLARSGVNTILLEQHDRLDREFRGYFFQPLVLKIFKQMGLLHEILQIEHQKIQSFHFIDHGKTILSVRFDELPKPYNYGLIMSQPLLLQFFIDRALKYNHFVYLNGTAAKELIHEGDTMKGLKVRQKKGNELNIQSRLIVGADGRYSTVRKLAGIQTEKENEKFDFVWFDMPVLESQKYPYQIQIEDEGMLVYIPKGRNVVQIGWVIQKGTYSELKKKGIEYFRKLLMAIDPKLKNELPSHLHDFKQCSVLNVQVATANQWVKDGLMIIGDAAHTPSPFGGQGNSLAIQDAVVAHSTIMKALEQKSFTHSSLRQYEEMRRPSVTKIQHIQRRQAQILGVSHPLLARLRRSIFPLYEKTPLFTTVRNQMTLGTQELKLETRYFLD
jgi:2-polyprenyl-6-methoxyphenol hydroxylase-like FAD-dependent oxidoreductase